MPWWGYGLIIVAVVFGLLAWYVKLLLSVLGRPMGGN